MSFASPHLFFLLLLVPLLLIGALLASQKRGKAWKRLVAARLESILVRSGSAAPRWISFSLALLALCLVITALAGPNAGYVEETETIRGRNLLLAIDISRSMLAEDESPNRLAAALAASLEIIDNFPEDRIGLIAFSGSSFLLAPLTVDHAAVRESIQQLDPVMLQQLDADSLPRGGSDVAQSVRLAIDTFKHTGQKNNALIILSDGENHEGGYEDAGDAAEDAGMTIFTAGFGTAEGAFLPDPTQADGRFRDSKNNLVFSRLNTDGLQLLSRRTGGFYTRGSGRQFASNLETAVQRLDRFELDGRKHRVAIPRFQWFLLPAILLLFLSMLINVPWRLLGRATAVVLALLCLPQASEARILPATPAENAFVRGEFEEALRLFEEQMEEAAGERLARLHLGAAAAAYRLADYDRAASSYSEALLSSDPRVQAEAHYALGNALFQRGDKALQNAGEAARQSTLPATITEWTNALNHYTDCLALRPDHEAAKANHAYVSKRLEELQNQEEQEKQDQQQQQQQQEQQQDQQEGEQEKDPENPEEGGEKGEEENQSNKPGESEEPGEEGEEGEQPGENEEETPPDSGEQQNGDQGEEPEKGPEQESSDQTQPGDQQPAPARPDETPEEHAQRILSENADLQTTPLMRRQSRQQRPEKDW